MQIIDNIKRIPLTRIRPNPWNPNEQSEFIFEKELASIRAFGFIVPILCRKVEETDADYEIIDGEHRWKAAQTLGMPEVPVNDLGPIDPVFAKQLTIILNETKGKARQDKLAALLVDLKSTVQLEQLLTVLPYTEQEFTHLIQDMNVDWKNLSPNAPKAKDPEGWRNVNFNLPNAVADQLEAQVERFKKLIAQSGVEEPGHVMAMEAICQCLSQTPDDHIKF